MSITREFQSQLTGAAITTPITTVEQLRDIIIQVVSDEGGMQFNQDRLAEILIAMLTLLSGNLSPVVSNVVLNYNAATNTLSIIQGGNVSAKTLNEIHSSFIGNIIPDNSTNYDALAALEATLAANSGALGSLQTILDALVLTVASLPNDALNGLNLAGSIIKLGGLLIENTTINGNALYNLWFNNLTDFKVNVDDGASNAIQSMGLFGTTTSPAFIKAEVRADPTQLALLRVDADGQTTCLVNAKGADVAGFLTTSEKLAKVETIVGGVTKSFSLDDNKHILAGIATKAAETKILWIDSTTKEIKIGDPPAIGASFSEYDAGSGVRVLASNTGITAAWLSGQLTVTIPGGVTLVSFRLALANGSNVQSGADGGGATNWIKIKITGTTGYNTDVTTMRVPSVQKTLYASGAPSVSNAFTIDLDNNPNVAVVDVSSNSITIRVWNLIIPNGAQFTFNGI